MRQRKVKNEEEKLQVYSNLLAKTPAMNKGRWRENFGNNNDIYVEIGCGKGQFITTLARENPDRNYIGIEGRGSVILRALEKTVESKCSNIIFINEFVNDVEEVFGQNELSGIYLNFSDPWPKDRHAKRRLIHTRYLEGYRNILRPEHFIEFKTDNNDLFQFALDEFEKNKMTVVECTENLHGTELPAKNITTEYEEKFKVSGKSINYCKVII
jgi:tRNA (guanine-N7-)-methyltransferase